MGGIDLLNETLKELEKKTSKKSREQVQKIKRYIKEEGVKDKVFELPKKIKPTKFLRLNIKPEKVYRHINDDHTINLDKQPTIILVHSDDQQLKQLESLDNQCLIYDFKYDANKQGLMINCENCYWVFKVNNKFCELMVKAIRNNGLGLYPPLYNKKWE
jgi:sugar-specific transcriptional regulator TrmB